MFHHLKTGFSIWIHGVLFKKKYFNFVFLKNGDSYYGQTLDGNLHGQGTYYSKSGAVYSGQWEKMKMNGTVKITYKNGDIYTGTYFDDKSGSITGKGTIEIDGISYKTYFENNKLQVPSPFKMFLKTALINPFDPFFFTRFTDSFIAA